MCGGPSFWSAYLQDPVCRSYTPIHHRVLVSPKALLAVLSLSDRGTRMKSHYHYQLLPAQKATESVAYIVLEHKPDRCSELPPNGRVRWQNITIEVGNMATALSVGRNRDSSVHPY